MALITLKPYLDQLTEEDCQPLLELLVEVVTHHPIDIEREEWRRYVAEVRGIREQFRSMAHREQLQSAVQLISHAVERRNSAISKIIARQSKELQNMITMLTRTIRTLGSASETSAASLETIAGQLKQASGLSDIRALRLRLGECLRRVEDEAARQRKQARGNIDMLQQELAASQQRLSRHGIEADIDRLTGFGGRTAAEIALHEAANAEGQHYVVLMVLGRLHTINSRFGYAMGDQIFCDFAAGIAGTLYGHGEIYRWSGPTLIAVLPRAGSLPEVRAEVARLMETPVSKSLETGEQNALITASPAWTVLVVTRPASGVIAQIDNFVSAQVPSNGRATRETVQSLEEAV